MKVNRIPMSPEEQARVEYVNYMARKQEANIEYIAMMTNVELHDDTDEVEGYGEQEI